MLQLTELEVPLTHRRKMLLIGAEPTVQGLVSTFLVTMGWTCTTITAHEEVSVVLQREAFDAVLVCLGFSEKNVESIILRIKQIRPSLADRLMVIRNSLADRETIEIIERHDLVQVCRESLLQHLWVTLQGLVAAPTRPRVVSARGVHIARMIFDSFKSPLPAGVRGLFFGTRHFAYQYRHAVIDLSLDCPEGMGRILLAGQVLDTKRKGKSSGLSVLLVGGEGTLARTATNQFGEFQMEFDPADDLSIEVRLGERSWVLIPLEKMDWIRKRTSNSQVEN